MSFCCMVDLAHEGDALRLEAQVQVNTGSLGWHRVLAIIPTTDHGWFRRRGPLPAFGWTKSKEAFFCAQRLICREHPCAATGLCEAPFAYIRLEGKRCLRTDWRLGRQANGAELAAIRICIIALGPGRRQRRPRPPGHPLTERGPLAHGLLTRGRRGRVAAAPTQTFSLLFGPSAASVSGRPTPPNPSGTMYPLRIILRFHDNVLYPQPTMNHSDLSHCPP